MSVEIQCENVTHRRGARVILAGIEWSASAGQLAGIVGNSGAGKTTLLRLIARLDQPTSGTVRLLCDHMPYTGTIGMVFQNLGLWPHLTARQHLTAVMRDARAARLVKAEAILRDMDLDETVWNRRPTELSGGEAQRLALARALANDPKLLLLDEPLAQLDAPLRGDLLQLLRHVATERQMTVVLVSHAWSDLAQLCDRVAVLADGRIAQEGAASDIYFQPKSAAIAQLTGPVVRLPRELLRRGFITGEAGSDGYLLADEETLLVRPQNILIEPAPSSDGWQVESCWAVEGVWSIGLRRADAHLTVPSVFHHPRGSTVRVALARWPAEPG